MTGFALLNFAEAGVAAPAIEVGDRILPVGAALAATGQGMAFPSDSIKAILGAWPAAEPTGSPAGNGGPRGIFLQAGQELTVEIERIGRLHNPIVQGE
jgi:hypothetical protein